MRKEKYINCEKIGEKVKRTDCPLCDFYKKCTIFRKPKSRAGKKRNPFNNLTAKPIAGFTNPKTGEIPAKEFCKQLKESQFRNDEALRFLTDTYFDTIGKQKLFNAEAVCFSAAGDMMQGNDPYLTKKHYNILSKAYNGDIGAIQTLIQANPEVLYLPFIAKGIISFLNKYKHTTKSGKLKIKEQWENFLPIRGGTEKNPYPDEIIKSVYRLALNEQQKRKSKTKAVQDIAKYLNISSREIYNIINKK